MQTSRGGYAAIDDNPVNGRNCATAHLAVVILVDISSPRKSAMTESII